ncbi:MAG TPA: hypothetical protein VMT27_09810 [Actinomycetes bacterium]|nr:hypothetical protein [Actinomycetes bacterium]
MKCSYCGQAGVQRPAVTVFRTILREVEPLCLWHAVRWADPYSVSPPPVQVGEYVQGVLIA